MKLHLDWAGDGLLFEGALDGGPSITLDGDAQGGASPMQALLGSVAACMAIDVVMILQKSRVPVEALRIEAEGDRAEEQPRRFTRIALKYLVRGPQDEHADKLQRAVDLSKDKYCSVLHTLKTDIDFSFEIERE